MTAPAVLSGPVPPTSVPGSPVLPAPGSPPAAPDPLTGAPGRRLTTQEVARGEGQFRLLAGLLIATVLLQRLVIPLGGGAQVPLLLPLALAVGAWGLVRGLLRIDAQRSGLVLLALGACTTTGVLALITGRPDASVLSVLYLVLTYLPFLLVLDRPLPGIVDRCLTVLTRLGVVVGVAAVAQVVLQPLGVAYTDAMASLLPKAVLEDGFNTSYPIVYGSPLYKANAWVFLEPSFCSQFLGLAFVVLLARGCRDWRLAVLAGGIVCTVAGTGMAVIAVGGLVLVLQRGLSVLRPLLVPLGLALCVAALTPVGAVLADRLTETGDSGSSGSLRFVQPFQVIGGTWIEDPARAVLGAGPGASERLAVRVAGSTALQQPAPLKLLYDYGAVAAVVFLASLLWVFLSGAPLPALTAALVAAWVILNSALLLPAVVVLLWTLTSLVSSAREPAPRPGLRARTA